MAQNSAPILVYGSGVAASCCLRLLQAQSAVVRDAASQSKLPTLLISQGTQNLLSEVFQTADLFDGLPAIRKRVVAWGAEEVVVLPHSGIVVQEQAMLERLRTSAELGNEPGTDHPEWSIFCSGAKLSDPSVARVNFGTRVAALHLVELAEHADRDACWVESVEAGWLFLLPSGAGTGSLMAVGGLAEQLLEESRLVSQQVHELRQKVAEFAAHPRIVSQLCGDGWLACGTAAMSFDPLCGEGAGNAAREAILASAAVQAILRGEPQKDVLAEYSLRLMLGFLRHLETCREFYCRQAGSTFWLSELALIEQGIVWTKNLLAGSRRPQFRLVGFGFERLAHDEKRSGVRSRGDSR